jgi:hypothetical protein
MAYTTINKPDTYFKAVTYTGTGTSTSVTTDFSPDLVWIKGNVGGTAHYWFDSVRGTGKNLSSNDSAAEDNWTSTNAGHVSAFNGTSFSLSADTNGNANYNGRSYFSWSWRASDSAAVTNTDGSITSTVSVNQTSGFSIFTYTGTGASTTTVGHGCSSEPKFVFIKNRSNVSGWVTYHTGAQAGLTLPNQASLILNGTNASANPASMGYLSDGYFSNVNSTTITLRDVNNANNVNATSNNYVGYAFAEVKGFSKFGSYIGNKLDDGVFVYTGFKPAFILFKNTVRTDQNWVLQDNKINSYNGSYNFLVPNSNIAQASGSSVGVDFLSNGFKMRGSDDATNDDVLMIYAAFAEQPLVGTNNVPATAR